MTGPRKTAAELFGVVDTGGRVHLCPLMLDDLAEQLRKKAEAAPPPPKKTAARRQPEGPCMNEGFQSTPRPAALPVSVGVCDE